MRLIQPPQLEEPSDCPYLPGRKKRYEFFLAGRLDGVELSRYLAAGWRKFGLYYFRPACPDCRACTPLRIPVAEFTPSREQRRVLKKAAALSVRFGPLKLSDRAFTIYREHARQRFGLEAQSEDFLLNFYMPSCPAMQSELFVEEEQAGIGILDVGADCLSSVYFAFDPAYAAFNPGTFSILKEIEQARALGLTWYYLGYYVAECRSLAYKDRFRPRQHLDWRTGQWRTIGDP
ncbi:arginyltransferase [Trichloromonas sp.]|uniref:arginyltransferase n=1 Tax=Trichloromonas sp. TaxID=3069249 RepID=UPI002A4453F1|nr:arginyltransferase [Trichloromonas sp.]